MQDEAGNTVVLVVTEEEAEILLMALNEYKENDTWTGTDHKIWLDLLAERVRDVIDGQDS